jgi:hypothetical protein
MQRFIGLRTVTPGFSPSVPIRRWKRQIESARIVPAR